MKYFSTVILSVFIMACGNSSSDQTKTISEPVIEAPAAMSLPSIPEEELKTLFMECDYVDYIFYELPVSMSYDNKQAIQSALQFVSQNADVPTSGCKAMGRMIFQKEGNQIMEAELFVSPSCGHYVWYRDGKKAYANMMTNTGQGHYMGIINQFVGQ